MRFVVFDLETKNIFSDVGTSDPTLLDLSIAGAYDSETDKYYTFLESELYKLWPMIEKADLLIGYNSDHFDIPLLNKYYPGDLYQIRSLDLLKEIRASLGRRIKLDQVAEGTLKEKKSGNGLEAVEWWRTGEIDKIREYCIKDVEITKKIYEYALKHNKLRFAEGGKVTSIPLDTSKWLEETSSPLTHTLPF
ncbi:MAG TPA: ribonuclease H-like domain-containing protein [Candidatus Paceibacterota bacterium]|nr:ribonuclease H-like domain-containing protein [Candidatus Paceibacterota bacterium]